MVLEIVLIIISEKSELIHIILYLFEKNFHNVIKLIKLVVSKNKTNYCHNIYLEKGLYKDESNIR